MNERELYEQADIPVPTFDRNTVDLMEEYAPFFPALIAQIRRGVWGFIGVPGFATATDLRAMADEIDRRNGVTEQYPVPPRLGGVVSVQ